MGIAIPDEIGTRRHFSSTVKAEEIEFILRVTERLPMIFEPVLNNLKNGTPLEEVQSQMEAIQMNLVEISKQIAVVMPVPNPDKH